MTSPDIKDCNTPSRNNCREYQPMTAISGITKLIQYERMLNKFCKYYDVERQLIWVLLTVLWSWYGSHTPMTIFDIMYEMQGRKDKGFAFRLRERVNRLCELGLLEPVSVASAKYNTKYYAPTQKAMEEMQALMGVIG